MNKRNDFIRTFSSQLFDFIEETNEYVAELSTLSCGGKYEIFHYDSWYDVGFYFQLAGSDTQKFVVQDIDKCNGETVGWRLIPSHEVEAPPTYTVYVLND